MYLLFSMSKPIHINILWLKKDLRLRDHAPLLTAIESGRPTLILFCFEPTVINSPEYRTRHFRFAYECLMDVQDQLVKAGHRLYYTHQEVISAFEQIAQYYTIEQILSYEEVGIKLTYDRDRAVKKWCETKAIKWQEFAQNGTVRGLKNRQRWVQQMERDYFFKDVPDIDLKQLQTPEIPEALSQQLLAKPLPAEFQTYQPGFQQGGERYAWRYFKSFLTKRAEAYSRQLSKPAASRISCSRLSPYLAFGCISARDVFQRVLPNEVGKKEDWNLQNFRSRIWWRSHYIQKLESDWRIEMEPINSVFQNLDRAESGPLLDAWLVGRTGFPMVDASIRCLEANGWINFRMRAMLVTFASFALWLDWRPVAEHLAGLFLDFEPGIHYPQIQMQAGLTGYHTLRIFNPTVQVQRHDQDGTFVKKWVPELTTVPNEHLPEPWKMTEMEQQFYQCRIGEDYPAPVVDYDTVVAANKDRYWILRQSIAAKENLPTIWNKFCIPPDIEKYKKEMEYRFKI